MKNCSIETCDGKHYARGWCRAHYVRWWRTGDVNARTDRRTDRAHVTAHGTVNEYNNYGCRCEACKKVASEYMVPRMKKPCPSCGERSSYKYRETALCRQCWAASITIPIEQRHGTEVGYSKGCRCDECRGASAKARRERRLRDSEVTQTYHRSSL